MELLSQPTFIKTSEFLSIEPAYHRVWLAGEPLYMSDQECIFLNLLYEAYEQGQPCLREQLSQKIYTDDVSLTTGREDRLDSLVKRLRRKLKSYPQLRIETIRGVGYQLYICPSARGYHSEPLKSRLES